MNYTIKYNSKLKTLFILSAVKVNTAKSLTKRVCNYVPVINPRFALTLLQFRYSAVDIRNPPCIITYLRTYLKYPQLEYIVKVLYPLNRKRNSRAPSSKFYKPNFISPDAAVKLLFGKSDFLSYDTRSFCRYV